MIEWDSEGVGGVLQTEDGLKLSLRRVPAREPEGGCPIVFLAGGPGDSAIGYSEHDAWADAFRSLAQSRDLLLLDQRGCGRSEPNLRLKLPAEIPANTFASEGSMRSWFRGWLVSERERLGRAPVDPWTSAADVDLLRRSVGGAIRVLGHSYGTHLAQAYLKRFPAERAVLCGFEGPDQTFKLPSQVQRQIERLQAAWGFDLVGSLAGRMERLDRTPEAVEVPDGRRFWVGGFAARCMVASWVSLRARWGLLQGFVRGETEVFAKGFGGWLKSQERPLTFYLCDAASGASAKRWERIRREAGDIGNLLGDAANFPFPDVAEWLGVEDLGDGFREPLRTETPILVLTGGLDGNTPTENALGSLVHLPNASHAELPGVSHSELVTDAGALARAATFLSEP